MLKKELNFKSYDGEDVTEIWYFDLNKTETIEMEIYTPGGLEERLNRMAKAKDHIGSYNFFKDLILKSVGKRSDDGKRFVKNQDVINDFISSPAYDTMITDFMEHPEHAVDFVAAIFPVDEKNQAELEKRKKEVIQEIQNQRINSNVQN